MFGKGFFADWGGSHQRIGGGVRKEARCADGLDIGITGWPFQNFNSNSETSIQRDTRVFSFVFGALRELKQKPEGIGHSWFNHLGIRAKNTFRPLDTLGRFFDGSGWTMISCVRRLRNCERGFRPKSAWSCVFGWFLCVLCSFKIPTLSN